MTNATFSPRTLRARKPHTCEACHSLIHPGETYQRCAFMNDGTCYSFAYHPDCRQWETELNQEHTSMFDDWCPLHEFVANSGPAALDGAPETVRARFQMDAAVKALGDE